MNKINFKSKLSLFYKNDDNKLNYSETLPKETINKNSTWFQTMEPISYAKNQTKKLYEIDCSKHIESKGKFNFYQMLCLFDIYMQYTSGKIC